LVCCLVDCSVVWLIVQLFGCLFSCLVGWLVVQLVDCLVTLRGFVVSVTPSVSVTE
jgi:hypothetical protein